MVFQLAEETNSRARDQSGPWEAPGSTRHEQQPGNIMGKHQNGDRDHRSDMIWQISFIFSGTVEVHARPIDTGLHCTFWILRGRCVWRIHTHSHMGLGHNNVILQRRDAIFLHKRLRMISPFAVLNTLNFATMHIPSFVGSYPHSCWLCKIHVNSSFLPMKFGPSVFVDTFPPPAGPWWSPPLNRIIAFGRACFGGCGARIISPRIEWRTVFKKLVCLGVKHIHGFLSALYFLGRFSRKTNPTWYSCQPKQKEEKRAAFKQDCIKV